MRILFSYRMLSIVIADAVLLPFKALAFASVNLIMPHATNFAKHNPEQLRSTWKFAQSLATTYPNC